MKTTLQENLDNETRWSFRFEIRKYFFVPYKVLYKIHMTIIVRKLSDTVVHNNTDTLCTRFEDVDDILEHLQDAFKTLLNDRVVFDGVKNCFSLKRTMHTEIKNN